MKTRLTDYETDGGETEEERERERSGQSELVRPRDQTPGLIVEMYIFHLRIVNSIYVVCK